MNRTRFYILLACLIQLYSVRAQEYDRIVSLAPSLTANLYYLESQDKLVGVTSYCEMAKPDQKPVVANAVQANIEKVIGLRPDLVLVTTLTEPETIEMIRKFGIHVEVFPSARDFEGICNQFRKLGKMVGQEDHAARVIHSTKHRVDSLRKECIWSQQPLLFMQIGAKPLFTVIPGTFMHDYLTSVNGQNLASDLKRGTITRETVVARNPDAIFIVSMGNAGLEEREIWRGFSEISAIRNDRIFILDSNLAALPTPVTYVKTLEQMVAFLKSSDL